MPVFVDTNVLIYALDPRNAAKQHAAQSWLARCWQERSGRVSTQVLNEFYVNLEQFVHFVSCITWLNNAWRSLDMIHTQSGNPLIGPAFRFALVEYCKPYKLSHGINRKFKLDTSFIPKERLPLHERIISSRDQIHAHSDLTVMDAKLHVHEFMGQRYTLIPQSIIHGTEELPNLQEIVALIEATLDNMYAPKKCLRMRLCPEN